MPRVRKSNIEIPGDWFARDRHLSKLAQLTGFRSINKLLSHLAYEVSHCRRPAQFYRACAQFYEHATRRTRRR